LGNIATWAEQLSRPDRVNLTHMPRELASVEANPRYRKPWPRAAEICLTPRAGFALLIAFSCITTLVIDLPSLAAAESADKKSKQDSVLKGLPITELSADEAIQHALNRLAYGPRPGEAEHIRQMGLAKWID